MSLSALRLDIANIAAPDITRTIDFLIDSGALYSAAPADVLAELGIQPSRKKRSVCTTVLRSSGKRSSSVSLRQQAGGAGVIFGEEGDCLLLGSFALTALGFTLDPLKRELRPLHMILAVWNP